MYYYITAYEVWRGYMDVLESSYSGFVCYTKFAELIYSTVFDGFEWNFVHLVKV